MERDAGGGSSLHRLELFAELVNLSLHLLLTFFSVRNDELRNCNGSRYQSNERNYQEPYAIKVFIHVIDFIIEVFTHVIDFVIEVFIHTIDFVIEVFLHIVNSLIQRLNLQIDIFPCAFLGRGDFFSDNGPYIFFGQFTKCG